jgi:hypothetical protein
MTSHDDSRAEAPGPPAAGDDTVLVCLNGHLVREPSPEHAPQCPECGAPAILSCPGCREPILGVPPRPREDSGQGFLHASAAATAPRYCHCCGRPFPWTERAVSAVRMAIRQVGALDPYERDQLRRCLDHLIHETPQTRLAVLRVNAALSRVGGETAASLRELFISIASDGVKQQLRMPGEPDR